MRTFHRHLRGLICGAVLATLWFLVSGSLAHAGTIVAVGSSEYVTDGFYAGLYKYMYSVTWTGGKGEGLSHWDLVIPDCVAEDGTIVFESDAGYWNWDGVSTGSHGGSYTVPYTAEVGTTGDPSLGITDTVIKWTPVTYYDEPGKSGSGCFWFYSDATPISTGYDGVDLVVGKQGNHATYGDLTGAYLYCGTCPPDPVPEPATLAFVAFGAVATVLRRVRR